MPKVKYKSWLDAGRQIVAKEGTRALFGKSSDMHGTEQMYTHRLLAGAGANVLRGVAGAGVLALYDQ